MYNVMWLVLSNWEKCAATFFSSPAPVRPVPLGAGHVVGQGDGGALLVPDPPGPGGERQHAQPGLPLEAGGRGAAALPGGPHRGLGVPGRAAPQEQHLHVGTDRQRARRRRHDNKLGAPTAV